MLIVMMELGKLELQLTASAQSAWDSLINGTLGMRFIFRWD